MADDTTDDEDSDEGDVEFTDDELEAMADAALAAVRNQRDRTHKTAEKALLAVLALLGASLDTATLLAVIDPDADRPARRAAVAAELQRQARITGHDLAWQTAARDGHTAAVLAGTAAAAHVLSAGDIPVDPAIALLPDPFDPAPWVTAQAGMLAGDIVDAAAARRAAAIADAEDAGIDIDTLTDAELLLTGDEVADIVTDGVGALYDFDQAMSDVYLDAATVLYSGVGIALFDWNTMSDGRVCSTCLGYASAGPYPLALLPGAPHGGCRCFATPTD